jgi:Lon protease-like protein
MRRAGVRGHGHTLGSERTVPLTAPNRLPLFPLASVLFPGGTIKLRIFERRYLDMIRDCARDSTCFGVCLILNASEPGAPAVPSAIGTRARIIDFYTLPDGLLGITACGEQRFHVDRITVRDSGLIVGDVRWLPDDTGEPVPAQHGLIATMLDNLLRQFDELPDDARLLDDAAWVGWRLSEMLPLDPCDRQFLLQMEDAVDRLDQLAQWLPRLGMGKGVDQD